MKKWENVGWGLSIFIVLTFLPPYLDKIGISLWLKSVYIFVVIIGFLFIVSKIKFLQKEVSNKVGWITLGAGLIIITILSEFILK